MIKGKVIYLGDTRHQVEAYALQVCEGVWYVRVDWHDYLQLDATGNGDDGAVLALYFSCRGSYEVDIQVDFDLPEDGFLFGEVSKKSYDGTYYTDTAYGKLVDKQFPD